MMVRHEIGSSLWILLSMILAAGFGIYAADVKVPTALPVDIRSEAPSEFKGFTYDKVQIISKSCGAVDVIDFSTTPSIRVQGKERCIMDPARYYVAESGFKFSKNLEGQCKRIFTCPHEASGSTMCSSGKKPTLTTGTINDGDAVFINEAGCDVEVEKAKAYRRWVDIKPMADFATRQHQPANHKLENAGSEYLLRIPRFDLGPASPTDTFEVFASFQNSHKTCTLCRHCTGTKFIVYETKTNEQFHLSLFYKSTCNWIQFCMDTDLGGALPQASKSAKCKNGMILQFALKNKLMFYGLKNEAIKVNYISSDNLNRIDITRNGKHDMTITTSAREKIVIPAYNTHFISVLAENAQCLEGTTLGMSMSAGCAADPDPLKPQPAPGTDENVVTFATVEPPPTPATTINPDAVTVAETTTVAPRPGMAAAQARNSAQSMEEFVNSKRKKGWQTWAIFFGCLSGSTLAFLISALIFYLCRRTAYNDWYRGMYKRYKCDASGTTGGPTGAEFGATTGGGMTTVNTVDGGNTTTSSTMQTTGGMTSTTTEAGTTGADTTGTNMTVTV